MDALLDSFPDAYEDATKHWLPRGVALRQRALPPPRDHLGDRILDDLGGETIPGGTLAAVVDGDGDHPFAALAWSNAGFLLALQERARATRD